MMGVLGTIGKAAKVAGDHEFASVAFPQAARAAFADGAPNAFIPFLTKT